MDVSPETLNNWVTQGGWDALRQNRAASPLYLAGMMEDELLCISQSIADRLVGSRFPTSAEARTRDIITQSIALYRSRIGLSATTDVMNTFLDFSRRSAPAVADALSAIADEYIDLLTQKETNARSRLYTPVPNRPDIL